MCVCVYAFEYTECIIIVRANEHNKISVRLGIGSAVLDSIEFVFF